MKTILYFLIMATFSVGGCVTDDNLSGNSTSINEMNEAIPETIGEETPAVNDTNGAKIISVSVTGEAPNYTFSVGIESPDTDCDQYADWWEVITDEGELIYRRILAHSHVTEQPFVRSGSGINVSEDQMLIIRAHMNNLGYGNQVYKGSLSNGFSQANIESDFAIDLATQTPLPNGCAF